MVYENKINNLNGKEWLMHSINFWTLEDLNRINFLIDELDCISDNHKLFLKNIIRRRYEELFL